MRPRANYEYYEWRRTAPPISLYSNSHETKSSPKEPIPPCGGGFLTPLRGQGWVQQPENIKHTPTEYTTSPLGEGYPPQNRSVPQNAMRIPLTRGGGQRKRQATPVPNLNLNILMTEPVHNETSRQDQRRHMQNK